MDHIAESLDSVAASLTTVERRLAALDVPAGDFGPPAHSAGTPGRLARRLHDHWSAVTTARAQEAAEAAHRLTVLADDVRTTAREYADTDAAVSHRLHRES